MSFFRGSLTRLTAAARTDRLWDRLGVGASIACAVHCMVAPLLFLAAPTFAGIWAHPSSHALIALLVVPLAGTVLFRGYRLHGRKWVAATALAGVACILVGSALPFLGDEEPVRADSASEGVVAAGTEEAAEPVELFCDNCCPQLVEDENGETTLGWPPASIATVLGSMLLVACHLGNLVACRCCGAGSSVQTAASGGVPESPGCRREG